MSDDQLLNIYRERDGMEPAARSGIETEMGIRGLGLDDVRALEEHIVRVQSKRRERQPNSFALMAAECRAT